jgi:hypothetical protein
MVYGYMAGHNAEKRGLLFYSQWGLIPRRSAAGIFY